MRSPAERLHHLRPSVVPRLRRAHAPAQPAREAPPAAGMGKWRVRTRWKCQSCGKTRRKLTCRGCRVARPHSGIVIAPAPAPRDCRHCGRLLVLEMFDHPCTFRRATYCGPECWQASRRTSSVVVVGEHAELRMANGCALISLEDVGRVARQCWRVDNVGYAASRGRRLHRFLLTPGPHMEVDHINRERLDCRRSNLRLTNHPENCRNFAVRRHNRSGTNGVNFDPRSGRWRARLGVFGRDISLGYFTTQREGVAARKQAELKHWGHLRGEIA